MPQPPLVRGGGHTRLRLKGWGSPNSNEGAYTVVLYICKYFVVYIKNWYSPNPSLASECSPRPQNRGWGGGGHSRLRVRGWVSPNSDDLRKSLALCLLCMWPSLHLPLHSASRHITSSQLREVSPLCLRFEEKEHVGVGVLGRIGTKA